jgi:hypothetical protein
VSQIDLHGPIDLVLLSGDKVYTVSRDTLYEYSVRELSHCISTYPLNDYVCSALIVDNRLYLGMRQDMRVFEVSPSLT